MRLRNLAVTALLLMSAVPVAVVPAPARVEAPVQAPHSIYVDVPPPGMLPGYLCAFPIKSSACAEDTTGWVGSSEDGRYK